MYLVNNKETKYIDCKEVLLPFGELFVNDVINRTETAMGQTHCFLAMELALLAQKNAQMLAFRNNKIKKLPCESTRKAVFL